MIKSILTITEYANGAEKHEVNGIVEYIKYRVFYTENDVEKKGFDEVWYSYENGEYHLMRIITHDNLVF